MEKHVHGGNIYSYRSCVDFSANCNPLGTPESVKKAVAGCLENIKDYPQVGYAPLREALGHYEDIAPEYVICGNGAAELIFSLCQAVKPKRALVPAPSFAEYEQALLSVGCQVEYVYLDEDKDFSLQEDFISRLHKDLDMIFLCNPNNPTGILMEREFLFRLLRYCRELHILLVVDECFLDFVKEPGRYSLKAQLSRYHNLFILKAFTKRYAMAGIRLGYGICENRELLEKMSGVTQPWNISVIAQAAGIAALEEKEYVEEGRRIIFQESPFLREGMMELGLHVYPSQANYLFFHGPEGLFEACIRHGVLIRDCSNYPGLEKGYYRIAVRTHEENKKLLTVLEEALTELRQSEGGHGITGREQTNG